MALRRRRDYIDKSIRLRAQKFLNEYNTQTRTHLPLPRSLLCDVQILISDKNVFLAHSITTHHAHKIYVAHYDIIYKMYMGERKSREEIFRRPKTARQTSARS